MDTIWIIIAIPIAVIGFLILSFIFGSAFRQWNEGDRVNKEQNSSSMIKTFSIGITIFIFIAIILSKCDG